METYKISSHFYRWNRRCRKTCRETPHGQHGGNYTGDRILPPQNQGHHAASHFFSKTICCFQENSRRKRSLGDLKQVFYSDPEVDWSEFQEAKVRVKRDPIRSGEEDKVRRDPTYDRNSYAYKFDRRLVDNLLPRKVRIRI